jgi:chemotaxis protein CheX
MAAFDRSVKEVLATMASVKPERLELDTNEKDGLDSFVSGNVGVSGCAQGTVSIGFTKGAIESIFSKILGGRSGEANIGEMADMAGELTNIVCGRARKALSERGLILSASDPTVTIGDMRHVHRPDGADIEIAPYMVNGHFMFIRICVVD